MEPALLQGDRLLVQWWGRAPRAGDLVVFHNPEKWPALLVKRVARVLPSQGQGPRFFVLGDNKAESRDSRHFGPVPAGAVLGRVVWVYERAYAGGAREPPPVQLVFAAALVLAAAVLGARGLGRPGRR